MIFKGKRKNKNNKFLNFIKNLFTVFFSIQVIIILLLLIWYNTNSIKNIYTPERIISIISQKAKNSIGFDIANANKYLKVYLLKRCRRKKRKNQ